jgi:hypothetical protein
MKKQSSKSSRRQNHPPRSSRTEKPSSFGSALQRGAERLAGRLARALSSRPEDIVSAIQADHDSLRRFLGLLKDTGAKMSARREAYAAFAALLRSHSASEEKAVYQKTRHLMGREMHLKVAEGYVEHRLADDLMKRIEATEDSEAWSAHANVLSEVVEHHLREEERDLLPKIRKAASPTVDAKMLDAFLSLRAKSQRKVTRKNAGVLE